MFRSPASEFVYVRTYSRWLEEQNRRENWPETVDRYINFITKHQGDKIPPKVLRKMRESLIGFSVMPSMRFLWAAGEAAEADNTTIYNCSFAAVDNSLVFSEALYVLMCGCGYGFSVENRYVEMLPSIPDTILPNGQIFVVEDSRKGWADSIRILVNSLYSGQDIVMDYNSLRPAGARLKTMGGRSSGPAPLAQLHSFIKDIFNQARGRQLTSLECHDLLNEIATIVVVGGTRRSSEISFSDLNDDLMRDAKTGNFPVRRYMANNSAVYYNKPDIVTFMKEWTALVSSGSGERGISNLGAAKSMAPKRRNAELIAGANPCVTGDTEILTKSGYARIDSLVNERIEIWNGFEWSHVVPKITGEKQSILKIVFSDGRILNCTPHHKFHIATDYDGTTEVVEAKDLTKRMKLIKYHFPILRNGKSFEHAYTQGFISAEGMDNYNFLWVYGPKKACISRLFGKQAKWEDKRDRTRFDLGYKALPKSFVPFDWDLQSKLDWLAGLFDGDGTTPNNNGIQLASVDRKFLCDVQKLISTLGINTKISPHFKGGYRMMPDGHGGQAEFLCQDSYRILIPASKAVRLWEMGMVTNRISKPPKVNRDATQFIKVVEIKENGIADKVYCFNEPKKHLGIFNGIVTGQCHEIYLRSNEFCNLSEVVARADDDLDTMLEKIETAVWAGIIQSCFTNFPYLDKKWKENCEEERLLGVSITGQFDAPHLFSEEALKAYKAKAVKVAKKASDIMGIPMPAAITCVKPSGTVSQLVDSASGLHPRFSKYYIRRYRIASTDPLFRMVRDQGVPVSPENGQRKQDYVEALKVYESVANKLTISKSEAMRLAKSICPIFDIDGWNQDKVNTWVVSFPVAAPKKAITVDDVTALEQLEWYKKVQENWCEHNASITVYVRPEEWLSVGDWVYKNWNIVNGISFLPYSDSNYEQMPYEKITKEEYQEMIDNFPKIDYTQLSRYEQEDNTEGAKTLACVGGTCEI